MLTYSKKSVSRVKQPAALLQKKKHGAASTIQTKLTVGKPNDKYEQEADRVANQVVSNTAIQRKCSACGQEEQPGLQRMEEEEVQAKPIPAIMKMEEEEPQAKLQKQEEEIQTKASNDAPPATSASVESKIQSSKGRGAPMDSSTKSYMEQGIGADFSGVRIHTDSSAIQMSQELGAQAFTVGRDVYFNSGKYQPQSGAGKHLLAHELTHVVQQTPEVRTKKLPQHNISNTGQKQISRWTIAGNTATVSRRGDTLAALANSITGNWKDWGCIWIKRMRNDKMGWTDKYPRYLEIGDTFDISNLTATTGKNATIVFRGADLYLQAIQTLYGGQGATAFRGQLADIAEYGKKPIQNLTLAGHSSGGRMWGDSATFVPGNHDPETPGPHGINSRSQSGPQRSWFTRNARVRFTGCSSQGVASSFASHFLRRGAMAKGTNHWICGWVRPSGARGLSVDNAPCNWATHTGQVHYSAAPFHGQAGLWVDHAGTL